MPDNDLELIGCSLDDFSDYLMFVDNNGQHYYLSLHRLIDLGGWGEINCQKRDRNCFDYFCADENLDGYEWVIAYSPENDVVEISGGKEFPDFDTIDDFATSGIKSCKISDVKMKIKPITNDFFLKPNVPTLEKTKRYFNL